MHGLPTNVDLSFLYGVTLLQICIGENEVILNFDQEVSIMVASNLRLTPPQGEAFEVEDAREAGASLLPLLGRSVTDVLGTSDGTLSLTWDVGHLVEILDTWKEFESYTVRHGQSLLVV